MDRSPIPITRLVTVLALLAMPAGAPFAQVVESYEFDPTPNLIIWGQKPYEFSPFERKNLIATAARTVSPNAPLFDLNAYHFCNRWCREVAHADLFFGPYEWSENTFSMDTISCMLDNPRRNDWGCEPKETWTYLRSEGIKSLVAFGSDVSLEAARIIAAYEDEHPYCRTPGIEKEKLTDRDAILTAHRISLDKETGNYRLGESCWLILRVTDGKIELIEKGQRDILY